MRRQLSHLGKRTSRSCCQSVPGRALGRAPGLAGRWVAGRGLARLPEPQERSGIGPFGRGTGCRAGRSKPVGSGPWRRSAICSVYGWNGILAGMIATTETTTMPKPRRYNLTRSRGEVETLQHLIDRALAAAGIQQRVELEGIASKVNRLLFRELVQPGVALVPFGLR